ncbi:pilus assembly protein TadG-related protein [Mesorhizobium sp. CA18]|uniref:TadG family pilus assembly protein n=1 Tax=unclassified Mesorhizobium TaxID=325217 RepID=UPI001CCB16E6|nr:MULTISPECIES: TadG family pilus assembly protein [unclassified Mesorhizobium]MBZ9733332.1 pilus assembly protein TadG-related protein [Mesorhizobium sp. CA9]MBZ9827445.1 pilus assembly protein TadG-related protein [Mesorhizobium sp. CA18]MBZ9833022.1 pilus assembly protein TadG-related protein [Mesorhizobium sp. CA2]MBZ9835158.1 pilus assembly protein TadG-related protein [Mesorhizobium sp. CA3]MBZ9876158.1 pilus assembly protein TadG-related protein [Mesorhizobium sp. Ca11]
MAATRRLLADRSANFAVMTALCTPVALALTAFAIDEGSLYNERRAAQSIVDLAAITAASNITNAQQAVLTALSDNGITSVAVQQQGATVAPTASKAVVQVVPGRYTGVSTIAAGSRFEAGKLPYNAVQVTLKKQGTLYFAGSIMAPPTLGTTAIASAQPQAGFSVGSRLASLNDGILNALLGGLLGGNISLSVMDYNSLVSADVDVLSFTDALATQLHLTGVSYNDVLASKATIGQIATAMANVPGLDRTAKLALQTMASSATNTVRIPLSTLIDLGSVGDLGIGQKPAGLNVTASALSMLTAAAALANGTNQVAVNLGATIPGLASTTLAIAIGEPMQNSAWLAVGEAGTVVRTAQTRIKLNASVTLGNSNLGGGINLLAVNLPLNVEVAHAEAKLTDITCPTGPSSIKVSIAAQPGVVSAHLANSNASGFADFTKPQSFSDADIADLKLLLVPLLQVTGSSAFSVTNMTPTNLTYNATDIANKAIKTVSTKNLTQSLTTSLVNNLSLSVNALGLGLDVAALLGTVKPAVTTLLNGVTAPVDDLLYNVLGALGVHVGEADVRVTGATCGRSVLVQ